LVEEKSKETPQKAIGGGIGAAKGLRKEIFQAQGKGRSVSVEGHENWALIAGKKKRKRGNSSSWGRENRREDEKNLR